MVKAIKSDTQIEKIERNVVLRGLADLMFDRYPGDNQTTLLWHQKIYLAPGSSRLSMPTANISSFLSSLNTMSAPKRLRDPRTYGKICRACLSFVYIRGYGENPQYIPITRDGKEISVDVFTGDRDPTSRLYVDRRVARVKGGIPFAKERPVLPLPWEIAFKLVILPNKEIKEQEIRNLFDEGGLALGLGTYRGVYGKFEIAKWE